MGFLRPRRLDRYLIREILGPLALGFSVYTFIMLIRFLFQSAEMIIRRGLGVDVVGELLLYSLPNIVVLTIPMAMLFAILIAVGRLSSDSELVALRASGVSLVSLYRPILTLSLVLTLINVALMVWALPWGNHSLQVLRFEVISETMARQVEPRVFYSEFKGKLLYVFGQEEGSEDWDGVFLAEALPGTRNEVTIAERGHLRIADGGEQVILDLENAVTHEVDFSSPDSFESIYLGEKSVLLDDEFASTQRSRISTSKSLREMSFADLRAQAYDRDASQELRNLAWVEMHKKFSIPAACLVFGLFALPLGFNNRRGGKASGFALSILVILVYYVMISNGEEAARFGRLTPWLAMWLPNIIMAVAGLLLLARRNRDKSLMVSRIDRWIRRDLWARLRLFSGWRKTRKRRRRLKRTMRRRAAQQAAHQRPEAATAGGRAADLVLRLPRPRLVFPNTTDRYVVRSFAFVFLLVVLSGLSIYIIADLSEQIDEIMKNSVPQGVVFEYYQYLSLQIFYELSPILVLIATLITFSLLQRTNEVTAWKALGISLYRLAVPAVMAALAIAAVCGWLGEEVLPASNSRVAQLNDVIRGREGASINYRRADRQWLLGQGRYVYNYLRYDSRREELQRLQVFEFDDQHRLVGRLVAQRATFDESTGRWLFEDGWVRRFDAGGTPVSYTRFAEPRSVDFPETPEYFDSEVRAPEQMDYGELRDFVQEVEASGQNVPELEVQLQSKFAYPVISLVMALVALPFAFRLGRQGALYGLGIAVVLGFAFYVVYVFFTTLGEAAALPPVVAVWSPSLMFGLLATYLFLGVRT